jgi:hypothetical protein
MGVLKVVACVLVKSNGTSRTGWSSVTASGNRTTR